MFALGSVVALFAELFLCKGTLPLCTLLKTIAVSVFCAGLTEILNTRLVVTTVFSFGAVVLIDTDSGDTALARGARGRSTTRRWWLGALVILAHFG